MAFRIYAEGSITGIWPADQLKLKSGKQAQRRSFSIAAQQGSRHPAFMRCTVWDDKTRLLDYLNARQKVIVSGAGYLSKQGKLSIDIERLRVQTETGAWQTIIDDDITPPADTPRAKETA